MQPDGAYNRAKLLMAGEALLVVEFGAKLTPAINDAVLAFDHYIQNHQIEGLLESAPTNTSVLLRFDPLLVVPQKFRSHIQKLLVVRDWFSGLAQYKRKRWRLPVCYGGEAGPDLDAMADNLSMPVNDIIKAHLSLVQRVFMVGFAPGFLYTGMLPQIFNLPRLQNIKPSVPEGSVSVAIGQSVISSTPGATGWHTIGRTPFLNFEPIREPPFVIGAGDEIEFYEIDPDEFAQLCATEGHGLESIEGEGVV